MAATFQLQYRNPALTQVWTTFPTVFNVSPGTVTGLTPNIAYDFRVTSSDGLVGTTSTPISVTTGAGSGGAFANDFSTEFDVQGVAPPLNSAFALDFSIEFG